jgi:virulence factor Mce-like protein
VKRIFLASLVAVTAAALAGFAASGFPNISTHKKAQYWVELDDAFGLIQGGDLKIAGVRAGTITDLKLNKRTMRARVGFRVTQNGFGDLRADTSCESRPQSLIGEYFLDCNPGTASKRLARGSLIPVDRTASTVAPDLVNDILRKPQAERLSLILSGLGTAMAGNAERLNAAIRRGVPALRETDRVLAVLAQQNKVIRDLNQHADTVVGDLAAHKAEVADWVVKARNISRDSATRTSDISAGWRKLPAFLAELRPAMAALGRTADAQGPALNTLASNATQLKRFFDQLGPFSDASRPALRALGQAGQVGSQAAKAATPTVAQLNEFAKGAPELGKNLAIVLEHLDNRKNTVEYDKRAAAQQGVAQPSGYSGLEGLLQYVFDQATSTNIYDQSTHILAVMADDGGQCKTYKDYVTVRDNAPLKAYCQAKTGPNAPGVDTADVSAGDAPPRNIRYKDPGAPANSRNEPRSVPPAKRDENAPQAPQAPAAPSAPSTPKPELPKPPTVPTPPPVKVPDPSQILPGAPPPPPVPPAKVPDPTGGKVGPPPGLGTSSSDNRGQRQVLDYLMGS